MKIGRSAYSTNSIHKLYAIPSVRVKSEAYFLLKRTLPSTLTTTPSHTTDTLTHSCITFSSYYIMLYFLLSILYIFLWRLNYFGVNTFLSSLLISSLDKFMSFSFYFFCHHSKKKKKKQVKGGSEWGRRSGVTDIEIFLWHVDRGDPGSDSGR